MNPFEMVVLIVAIVALASVLKNRRDRARAAPEREDDAEIMRAELVRLRERVEVLERLATDRSRRLSDEIDDLRR